MKKGLFSILMALFVVLAGLQDAYALVVPDLNNDYYLTKAPTNLQYTCTGEGVVTLTWKDNSSNETGFVIERRSPSYATFDQIDQVPANTTSYIQNQTSSYPVFPGENFYYRVKAVRGSFSSAYSNEILVAVTNQNSPIAPGDLKLIPLYYHGLKITWSDRSNNENGFVVERKKQGGVYSILKSLSSNTHEYEITGNDMTKGSVYIFRVKAFNNSGLAYSSEASINVPETAPAAPYFVANMGMLALTSPSSMTVKWQDISNNEDGFAILRKDKDSSGDFNFLSHCVGVVDKNVTTFVDSNLPLDEVYEYSVASYNMNYFSRSGTVQAPITGPKTPVVSAAAVSQTEAKITWSCPSTGVDFKLERKNAGGQYQMIHNWFYASENISSYNDTNLTPGQTYYYRLWAGRNAAIYALASAETSVTLPTILNIANKPGSNISNTVNQGGLNTVIKVNLGQTAYQVGEQVLQMEAAPMIHQGRTMLPIKYITEPLGATLSWDPLTQKITIVLGSKKIELWIGKGTALVNGQQVAIDSSNLDVMPIIVPPGRTMLPLSFISNNLGCQVEWNQATQQVVLSYTK